MTAEECSFSVSYKPNETHQYGFNQGRIEEIFRDLILHSVFAEQGGQWTVYIDVRKPVAPGRKPSKQCLNVSDCGKENCFLVTIPGAWLDDGRSANQTIRFYLYPSLTDLKKSLSDVRLAMTTAAESYNRGRSLREKGPSDGPLPDPSELSDPPHLSVCHAMKIGTGEDATETWLLAIAIESEHGAASNGAINPGACRVVLGEQLGVQPRDSAVDEALRILFRDGWLIPEPTCFTLSPRAKERIGFDVKTMEDDTMDRLMRTIGDLEQELQCTEQQVGVHQTLRELLPQSRLGEAERTQIVSWLDTAEAQLAAIPNKINILRQAADILSEVAA